MLPIAALVAVALVAARVLRAPAGVWLYILGAAALAAVASQLLPAGHPLRADVAGSLRTLAWLAAAALPIAAYALWVRSLRRRAGAQPEPAPAHPVGLVQIAEDAALVADTAAALAAEARAAGAAGTLSLGWRALDGTLAGHLRLRQIGETAEVEALWVAGEHRGRGIGGGLIAAAADEARRRGLRRLAVAAGSWQSPGFFRHAGFAVVAERPLGTGLARIWMEREIP